MESRQGKSASVAERGRPALLKMESASLHRKVFMKAKSILLLLAVCFPASAALAQQQDGGSSAPQVPVVNAASSGAPSLDSMGVKKYLLGPGDALDLRVYNEPQFNSTLVVNDEGNIEVPFIDQPVPAQCRNDREIKADRSEERRVGKER